MSGGGGGGTNTIEKSAEPWAEQKPYLTQGFEQAQQYLNSDKPQYFPGSTVAPVGAQTQQGIQALASFGGSPGLLPQAAGAVGGVMQQGGGNALGSSVLSGVAQNGLPNYGQVAAMQGITQNGADLAGNPTLQGLAQGGVGANGGVDYLNQAARGDFLTNQNPYTAEVIRNAQALGRSPVDAQFAGMGRYGGGSHVAALADSANRISTQALMQDFQQERQLQQGAAGQLATFGLGDAQLRSGAAQALNQAGLSNAGLQLSGAQALQGAAGQDAAQRMAAAQGLIGQGNTDAQLRLSAAGMLPTLDQAELGRINAALQAGQMGDAQAQALLQDQINRFNFDQNSDLTKLQNYMALVGGNSYGSTEKTTTPLTQPNRLMTAGGGAMTGAMLGSYFGPWGTAIGAVGGGLLGAIA